MDLTAAHSFVAERHNGVLATLKRDGRPQLSNITYLWREGAAWISITAGRAKYTNLARDPRASLHVTRDDFWGYVVLEGTAALSPVAAAADDATVEDLVVLYRTLRGEHPDWTEYRTAMVTERRLVVRLAPTHAYGMPGDG